LAVFQVKNMQKTLLEPEKGKNLVDAKKEE
jgi:hypothetical protein